MNWLDDIERELNKETELLVSIDECVQFILTQRQFRFKKEEVDFDLELLLDKNVIESKVDEYTILGGDVLFVKFFRVTSLQFGFELSSDVASLFGFVEQVQSDFRNRNVPSGIARFFNAFSVFLMKAQYKIFQSDFVSYVNSLTVDSPHNLLYGFSAVYSEVLSEVKFNPVAVYRNIKHLLSITTGNRYLIGGLVVYCEKTPDAKGELIKLGLAEDPIEPNLLIAPMSVCYRSERESYWQQLIQFGKNPHLHVVVLRVFVVTKALTNAEAQRQIGLVKTFPKTDAVVINYVELLFELTKGEQVDDTTKQLCWNELTELIRNYKVAATATLNQLGFFEQDFDRVRILIELVDAESFEFNQAKLFGNTFFEHRDIDSFERFLFVYINRVGREFEADSFSTPINRFLEIDSTGFSRLIIRLLTNDVGEIRRAGVNIFDRITSQIAAFKFATNLLEEDALTQYKLWLIILQEYREPKFNLPAILPLVDSQYPMVKEALLCKLEELIESYSGSVVVVVKSEFEKGTFNDGVVVERLDKYLKMFHMLVDAKRGIRELDPTYSQAQLFRNYSNWHVRGMQEYVKKSKPIEGSLLGMLHQVILAKGGGWKNKERNEVVKLGRVQATFQFPRAYFISPQEFEWERAKMYSNYWNETFFKCAALISS